MASPLRVYLQRRSHGCEGRRHLPDVVPELRHGARAFFRRQVPRARPGRAPPLHGPVRRPKPARRDAHDSDPEAGVLWDRAERGPGRDTGGHSSRDVLSRVAGRSPNSRRWSSPRYRGESTHGIRRSRPPLLAESATEHMHASRALVDDCSAPHAEHWQLDPENRR